MSDSTTMTDEVFDEQGTVVSSVQRTARPAPTLEQLRAIRLELRNIMNNAPTGGGVVPLWGRNLARALLWYTFADDLIEAQPIQLDPNRPPRTLDADGNDVE